MVQWLRLCTSTAGGKGLIPGQGTKKSHMPHDITKKKAGGWGWCLFGFVFFFFNFNYILIWPFAALKSCQ